MAIESNYFKVQREFAFDLKNLDGSSVKLYLFLRQAVNENRKDSNLAFPSYGFITENTGLSSSSIKRAINQLIETGWIEKIDKGFNAVNKYYLVDKNNKYFQNESTSKMKEQYFQDESASTSILKAQVLSKRKSNKNNINNNNIIRTDNNICDDKSNEESKAFSNFPENKKYYIPENMRKNYKGMLREYLGKIFVWDGDLWELQNLINQGEKQIEVDVNNRVGYAAYWSTQLNFDEWKKKIHKEGEPDSYYIEAWKVFRKDLFED
jgi:hypothetical protein